MANEQVFNYTINTSFGENDDNLIAWNSTQYSELNGKFVSIIVQLRCECHNSSSSNGAYNIVLENSSVSDSEENKFGIIVVRPGAETLVTKFSKVFNSKTLLNNGDCNAKIILRKEKFEISNRLSGRIVGTVKCTVTDVQNSDTTVALDKNAITDWFKTLSVDGAKSGESVVDQESISYSFPQSSLGHLLWRGDYSKKAVEKVAVSLDGRLINVNSSSKTVEFIFTASGSQTFSNVFATKVVPANSSISFSVSAVYTQDQLPNNGVCDMKINITNTEFISGQVLGGISVECVTLSNAETDDYTDDSDIQGILNNLFGEGYSVGGSTNGSGSGTDSFMNAYSGQGYDDDSALINADYYKTMGMTDDVAAHLQQLEARITALENRMTELDVGGSDIDWYDGGYTGSDDTWGIGNWYEQDESRISQVGMALNSAAEMLADYTVDIQNKKMTQIYATIDSEDKQFVDITYEVMVSHLKSKESWYGTILNFYIQSETETEQGKRIKIGDLKFENENIVTKQFKDTIVGSKLINNGVCTVNLICEYISPYNIAEETEELFDDLIENLKGKMTTDLSYTVQDVISQEDKIKESNNTNVDIDVANFTGEQNIFSYSAQSNNTNLQSIDFSLTLGYTYDTAQSQVCVGQKVKMYFRTIANHGGFADEITEFPLGEFEITADSPTKQYVIKDKYTTRSFANNGNCIAYVVFTTPNITQAKLADFKQHFSGNVKGNINYKAVAK